MSKFPEAISLTDSSKDDLSSDREESSIGKADNELEDTDEVHNQGMHISDAGTILSRNSTSVYRGHRDSAYCE